MTTPPHGTAAGDDLQFDDPGALAAVVADAPRPLLIGLDIDGVLAPIVAHADDSELLDGVAAAVGRLANRPDVTVAAVSGRSLASIRSFGLPDGLELVGGHGMERSDRPTRPLDDEEAARLTELRRLADDAAAAAGDGAWVEQKSASVVLHVRQADRERGSRAIATLDEQCAAIEGAEQKHGSEVLELFARSASKGAAMATLGTEAGAATSVFVGDDVTDEEAFAALADFDIAIKVGSAATIAGHRLRDPAAVLAWLRALGDAL
ncbi:MAG: trehalose-phosphatase [Ilumatobacter sp.]|nr:trehalose-phosphatase [Ilumatobacter sp.]